MRHKTRVDLSLGRHPKAFPVAARATSQAATHSTQSGPRLDGMICCAEKIGLSRASAPRRQRSGSARRRFGSAPQQAVWSRAAVSLPAGSGGAAQPDLFCATNHSIEPGAGPGRVGCGLRRCSGRHPLNPVRPPARWNGLSRRKDRAEPRPHSLLWRGTESSSDGRFRRSTMLGSRGVTRAPWSGPGIFAQRSRSRRVGRRRHRAGKFQRGLASSLHRQHANSG